MAQLLHKITRLIVLKLCPSVELIEIMADDKQAKDLSSLSQSWSERVKHIREMAKGDELVGLDEDFTQFLSKESTDKATSTEEIFSEDRDSHSGDSLPQDIFVDNTDFYDYTNESVLTEAESTYTGIKQNTQSALSQKVLIISLIITILVVLSYGLFLNFSSLKAITFPNNAEISQVVLVQSETVDVESDGLEFTLDPDDPISLRIAQESYQKAEYPRSYVIYKRLLDNLPGDTNSPLREYIQLSMALCQKKAGNIEKSVDSLKKAAAGDSAVLRAYANYHLSLIELDKRQFLLARRHAYQAIALLDAINLDIDWCHELQRNCYFLASEATTRQVLLLSDKDVQMPAKLWPEWNSEQPPLSNYGEQELRTILETGSQVFQQAVLSPKIQKDLSDALPRWTVICNGASIEELINRISSNMGQDVRWEAEINKTKLLERPVKLYLSGVSGEKLITIAAGTVGLLAYIDESNTIAIYNPTSYSYTSEQLSRLTQEAVSSWQRYLLAFYEDRHLPNAHFALGTLRSLQGMTAEASAQYKIVSGRFSDSRLGPSALVCTSKLKASIHDYQGSYQDLVTAVQQYPDDEQIDQTYLALAAAAEKINNIDQAAKIYSKVYYLKKSKQSQLAAAFSAGKLFFENQNYSDAEEWLSKYLDLTEGQKEQNVYKACAMLGRTWLIEGNTKSACQALKIALSKKLPQDDYIDTVTILAEAYIADNCFVDAIGLLNDTSSPQLTATQSVDLLLLRSQACRNIGLTEEAISLLTEKEEYILDDLLKAEISYELCQCYIEQGQLNLAYRRLSQILEQFGYNALEYEVAYCLADTCLKLEMYEQSLKIGSQLLQQSPPQAMKKKTLELLAVVCGEQKNYDRAALALMGQWK